MQGGAEGAEGTTVSGLDFVTDNGITLVFLRWNLGVSSFLALALAAYDFLETDAHVSSLLPASQHEVGHLKNIGRNC